MNLLQKTFSHWFLTLLVTLVGSVLLLLLWNVTLTTNVGNDDFVAYWSSTYLFHNGQNPYDPELMGIIQNTELQAGLDYVIMSWNPPSLFVFLLPLAWLPYTTAKFVWLTVNLIIVMVTNLMLAKLYLPADNTKLMLTFLVLAALLPQVVSGIFMGQITFLVFLGVVACMTLIKREQWFWAGVVLILTTIKPHIANLSVIYLLIYTAKKRQYQSWAGLAFAAITCLAVLFIFRPEWPNDLAGLLRIAPVNWATPTIGGILSYLRVTNSARYLLIIFLPLPFLLAKYPEKFSMEFSVALLTLITIPTTFYGWSYDQTILLIPIAQIFGWISRLKNKIFNIWLAIAMGIAFIISYFQRAFIINDVYYLWIPLFWLLVFGVMWRRVSVYRLPNDPQHAWIPIP